MAKIIGGTACTPLNVDKTLSGVKNAFDIVKSTNLLNLNELIVGRLVENDSGTGVRVDSSDTDYLTSDFIPVSSGNYTIQIFDGGKRTLGILDSYATYMEDKETVVEYVGASYSTNVGNEASYIRISFPATYKQPSFVKGFDIVPFEEWSHDPIYILKEDYLPDGVPTKVDDVLSITSANPVQNKVVAAEIGLVNSNIGELMESHTALQNNLNKLRNSSHGLSGVKGAFDIIHGENLLDPNELEVGRLVYNYDTATSYVDSKQSNYLTSGFIPVNEPNPPGGAYTLQSRDGDARKIVSVTDFAGYNDDKGNVMYHQYGVEMRFVPTHPGTKYVRFSFLATVAEEQPSFVEGTEIVPFEEYHDPIYILKEDCLPDGIDGGSAEGAVLYTEQSLTEAQKAQARENIGVGTGGNVSDETIEALQQDVDDLWLATEDQEESIENIGTMATNALVQVEAVDLKLGNIKEALDAIIKIQEDLIGGDVTLITFFTPNGTEQQAEEGMTWGQWINSKYNHEGYILLNGYVSDPIGNYIYDYADGGQAETEDLAIIAGHNYIYD